MPSDASVYNLLGAGVTPLLNPLEIQAKKLAIQNEIARQSLIQQEQTKNALAIDESRRQAADQQAYRSAMTDMYSSPVAATATPINAAAPPPPPSALQRMGANLGSSLAAAGVDVGSSAPAPAPAAPAPAAVPPRPAVPTMADLLSRGVAPADAAGLITHFQAIDKSAAEIDKIRKEAADKQQSINASIQQHAADMANGVLQATPKDQPINPDLLGWHLQNFASLGEPEALQAAQIRKQLAAVSPADQKALLKSLATPKTQDANAAADNAQLGRDKFNAERAGIDSDNKLKALTAAGKAPIQPADAARISLERQRVAIEASNAAANRAAADPWGTLGINPHPIGGAAGNLHGGDFLATLPPAMAATVRAVAEGRQTNLPRGGKELDQLMGAVNQYDPTYSVQRGQMRSAFLTGKQGQNIGNLNTAVVHLDQYHEVMKALNNGSFQPGNHLYNWVAERLGSAAVTNPDFVRHSLAGEAANALKGNATDPEIAGIMATLGKDQSPKQQEGTALEGLRILGAKLNTYDEQYHQMSPDDPWTPVLPSARSVFSRYKIQPLSRISEAPASAAAPAAPAAAGAGLQHKSTDELFQMLSGKK